MLVAIVNSVFVVSGPTNVEVTEMILVLSVVVTVGASMCRYSPKTQYDQC